MFRCRQFVPEGHPMTSNLSDDCCVVVNLYQKDNKDVKIRWWMLRCRRFVTEGHPRTSNLSDECCNVVNLYQKDTRGRQISVMNVALSSICTRRTPDDVESQRDIVDPGDRVDLDALGVDWTGQSVGHDRCGIAVAGKYHLKYSNDNIRGPVVT